MKGNRLASSKSLLQLIAFIITLRLQLQPPVVLRYPPEVNTQPLPTMHQNMMLAISEKQKKLVTGNIAITV